LDLHRHEKNKPRISGALIFYGDIRYLRYHLSA
jgi:hypothetical protein